MECDKINAVQNLRMGLYRATCRRASFIEELRPEGVQSSRDHVPQYPN